jgi:hypothetical protein
MLFQGNTCKNFSTRRTRPPDAPGPQKGEIVAERMTFHLNGYLHLVVDAGKQIVIIEGLLHKIICTGVMHESCVCITARHHNYANMLGERVKLQLPAEFTPVFIADKYIHENQEGLVDPDLCCCFLYGSCQYCLVSLAFEDDLQDLDQIPVIIEQQDLFVIHDMDFAPPIQIPFQKPYLVEIYSALTGTASIQWIRLLAISSCQGSASH